MEENTPEIPKRFGSNKYLNIFFIIAFSVIFLYYMLSAPISSQSVANRQETTIHVAKNQTLTSIANELETKKVVRQATALKIFVTLFGAGHRVPRGDYVFRENVAVWKVAWDLARGNHNINPIRVTIKEGATNEQLANLLGDNLLAFRRDLFLSLPKSKQGYLFPDTYFFFPRTTADEIIDELSANFENQISPLKSDIEKSGHTLNEIIVMASLIQKEAQGEKDANIVSGILWKRIQKGMPLQVDAERSTYANIGLPKNPIGNPGLMAIKASLYPEDSAYLYYLHDKTGAIHLAKTFAEHKANINRYLR